MLSVAGFLISAGIHVAVLNSINVQNSPVTPFALHAFAILCFAASMGNLIKDFRAIPPTDKPASVFALVVARTPRALQVCFAGLLMYGLANFLVAMPSGTPTVHDGAYSLQNHGTTIREITEEEYLAAERGIIRGFSGYWMLFLFMALMLSLPASRKPSIG
ncbi:MAG: hypothetical protein K8S54_08395 [Spirochaetia bacterium]|nr:hypothetical protein [Spirochaetia bacterium]